MLRKLNDITIGTKLLVLIVGLAGSTAVVGALGYWALNSATEMSDDLTSTHLPGTENLLAVKVSLEKVKTASRTLVNSGLDPAIRDRQYDLIARADDRCQAALKTCETLLQEAELRQPLQQFLALVQQYRTEYLKFTEMTKRVTALGVGDSKAFLSDMERFRGDHYRLALQVNELLQRGESFNGGHDHSACRFGQWRAAFETTNPELQNLLRDIETPHQIFHQGVAKIKELVKADKQVEAREVYTKEVAPNCEQSLALLNAMCAQAQTSAAVVKEAEQQLFEATRAIQLKVEESLDALIKNNNDFTISEIAHNKTASHRAEFILVTVVCIAILFGVALGWRIASSIKAPIAAVVAHLEEVAGGNLQRDVPEELTHRHDEVGTLGRALMGTVTSLRQIIGGMATNSQALAGASTELSATATQLASGAEQTTNQSAQVAAAAEQMTTNMTGMAASTEQMSTNVKVVSSAVDQLTASIGEVAQSAEKAAGVAHQAAELVATSNGQITELGSAADEIGKVIEIIQDIAEQTNLLALNATIEAARAGDAGKGFAVVATEVKELAKQTGSATEDIRKRIEGIQGSTGQAVKSIGDISTIIHEVNELSRTIASAVEEQSITTKEIAKNVSQSADVAHTVARGVAETATVSQEIARTIAGVDQAARQAAQGAAQTQTAGRELSRMAEQFQGLVGQFRV